MPSIETGTETVLAEVRNGVGLVILNRAERRNALHYDMYDAVPAVLERFIDDDAVGCILLTGAGSAFCAGGDVRDGSGKQGEKVASEASVAQRTVELTHKSRMVRLLHDAPKVTIAALPGGAVGAGMGLALSTDFRIAAQSATLVPGWGRLGFSGDFGGSWFLTRMVGHSRALEILLDGSPIDAERALQLGLFNRVVPDGDLPNAAFDWAAAIAAGPTIAWGRTKQNVLQAPDLTLAEALPLESERMVLSGRTEEHRAAVRLWMDQAAARRKESDTRSG